MTGQHPDPAGSPHHRAASPLPGEGSPALQEPPHGPGTVPPLWSAQPRGTTGTAVTVLLISGASLALLLVAWFLWAPLGSEAFVLCGILALVPLGICLLGLRWVDRWEPEPRSALLFALLWGAGISVGITLLAGPYVGQALHLLLPSIPPELVTPLLEAPVVEETAKALGVLILVFTRRSHFDGPVDGIVYAGTVAAGFAFTENILYFGSALLASGGLGVELGFVFVLRGLFSPFAHVLFTSAVGLCLGFAVARGGTLRILAAFFGGLVPAVIGHMFWNGGTALVDGSFFVFYFLLQVPFFALSVTGVVFLRRAEQRLTRQRLGEYAVAGWFTPQEVLMLSTRAGRHQAMSWAGTFGARTTMRNFIQEATRLALTRQQIAAGRNLPANTANEQRLLDSVTRTRGLMLARAGGQPAGR
ncbi:PrsW family intramembrane metalloprotease [Arthrobacter jiangjiafuii]|uniref:PrsW family intramembrane metalloprotease n=1 Tax=Arthrobacter jiangjiafuii TaxID=2817475 RepID=A0A975M2S9_9MICC|nr:PrsW family intramembrane metalloprotease [Arthrobacter jiangjiafuii]MBP3043370.1 PrsW family intramembrane metalloprotease [Arthrobacter jiangjiafuii]QWC08905.1 PrsW family intramembrane metalloprotease [Arthrobacter jiangjiafuii]